MRRNLQMLVLGMVLGWALGGALVLAHDSAYPPQEDCWCTPSGDCYSVSSGSGGSYYEEDIPP